MKTLQATAQAILDDDKENGHVGSDIQWGKYESNARAVLLMLERRGIIRGDVVNAILKGEK